RDYPPCMQPERVGRKANFVTCKKNVVELPRPHVRFGSEADICSAKGHDCFTPESGHVQCTTRCQLWVKSRHSQRNKACPLYPRKRTCAVQLRMSAKGQKRTCGNRRLNLSRSAGADA